MSRNFANPPSSSSSSSSSTHTTRSHFLIKDGTPFLDGPDNLSLNAIDGQNRKPLYHIDKNCLDEFLARHDFLLYGYFTDSVDNEKNTACHLLFQKMEENFDLDKDPQRIRTLLRKLSEHNQLYNCINHKNNDGQTVLQKVIMAWVGGIMQASDEKIIALKSPQATVAVESTSTNPQDDDDDEDIDKNSKSKRKNKNNDEKPSDGIKKQVDKARVDEEQEDKITKYRDDLLIEALEFIDNIFPGHIISAVTKPYDKNSGNSILHSLLKAETELRWDRIEGNTLFNILTEMAQMTLIITKTRNDIAQNILLPNSYLFCLDSSQTIRLNRALSPESFTKESLDNIANSLDTTSFRSDVPSEQDQFNQTYEWISFNLKKNKEVDTTQKRIIRQALIKSPAVHKRDPGDFIQLFTTVNPKTAQNLIETAISTTFSVATDSEQPKPHKVTNSSHLTPSRTDNYQLLSWVLRQSLHERESNSLHKPFTDTLVKLFYRNDSGEYSLNPKMLDLCIQLVDIDPHLFFQMIHFGNDYLTDDSNDFVIRLHQHLQQRHNKVNELPAPQKSAALAQLLVGKEYTRIEEFRLLNTIKIAENISREKDAAGQFIYDEDVRNGWAKLVNDFIKKPDPQLKRPDYIDNILQCGVGVKALMSDCNGKCDTNTQIFERARNTFYEKMTQGRIVYAPAYLPRYLMLLSMTQPPLRQSEAKNKHNNASFEQQLGLEGVFFEACLLDSLGSNIEPIFLVSLHQAFQACRPEQYANLIKSDFFKQTLNERAGKKNYFNSLAIYLLNTQSTDFIEVMRHLFESSADNQDEIEQTDEVLSSIALHLIAAWNNVSDVIALRNAVWSGVSISPQKAVDDFSQKLDEEQDNDEAIEAKSSSSSSASMTKSFFSRFTSGFSRDLKGRATNSHQTSQNGNTVVKRTKKKAKPFSDLAAIIHPLLEWDAHEKTVLKKFKLPKGMSRNPNETSLFELWACQEYWVGIKGFQYGPDEIQEKLSEFFDIINDKMPVEKIRYDEMEKKVLSLFKQSIKPVEIKRICDEQLGSSLSSVVNSPRKLNPSGATCLDIISRISSTIRFQKRDDINPSKNVDLSQLSQSIYKAKKQCRAYPHDTFDLFDDLIKALDSKETSVRNIFRTFLTLENGLNRAPSLEDENYISSALTKFYDELENNLRFDDQDEKNDFLTKHKASLSKIVQAGIVKFIHDVENYILSPKSENILSDYIQKHHNISTELFNDTNSQISLRKLDALSIVEHFYHITENIDLNQRQKADLASFYRNRNTISGDNAEIKSLLQKIQFSYYTQICTSERVVTVYKILSACAISIFHDNYKHANNVKAILGIQSFEKTVDQVLDECLKFIKPSVTSSLFKTRSITLHDQPTDFLQQLLSLILLSRLNNNDADDNEQHKYPEYLIDMIRNLRALISKYNYAETEGSSRDRVNFYENLKKLCDVALETPEEILNCFNDDSALTNANSALPKNVVLFVQKNHQELTKLLNTNERVSNPDCIKFAFCIMKMKEALIKCPNKKEGKVNEFKDACINHQDTDDALQLIYNVFNDYLDDDLPDYSNTIKEMLIEFKQEVANPVLQNMESANQTGANYNENHKGTSEQLTNDFFSL